jgi:hypothetical protein
MISSLKLWIGIVLIILLAPIHAYSDSTYRVTRDIPTLGEISIFLYGTTKMAKEIAQWNQLQRTDHLRIGQKLLLKKTPTLTEDEGKSQLLAMWRKRFGLTAILSNTDRKAKSKTLGPPPTPITSPSTPAPKIPKHLQKTLPTELKSGLERSPGTESKPNRIIIEPKPPAVQSQKTPEQSLKPPPTQVKTDHTPSPSHTSESVDPKLPATPTSDSTPTPTPVSTPPPPRAPIFVPTPTPAPTPASAPPPEDDQTALERVSVEVDAYPDQLALWFKKMFLLNKLGKKEELKATIDDLLEDHPHLKNLPTIKKYQKEF